MSDLDEIIRDGLEQAANEVRPLDRQALASALAARRGRRSHRRSLRFLVAAALVAVAVGAGVVLSLRPDGGDDGVRVVTSTPDAPDGVGFDDLGPGWHRLDTGPVPASSGVHMAWTGSELVVAAGDGNRFSPEVPIFAYSPPKRRWRRLPDLPFRPNAGTVSMVWTGSVVVAVDDSFPSARSAAAWNPATNTWRDIGRPPVPQPALDVAAPGLGRRNGGLALVWTGRRVLDLTHGSAWDPATSRWSVLPFPDDMAGFAYLVGANPVVVEGEAVLAAWTSQPGLAWNAMGTSYREVPGLPADLATAGLVEDSAGIAGAGGIVLVSGTDSGRAASLDPRTGTWKRLPSLPGSASQEGCPRGLAGVSGRVVARRCDDGQPAMLTGDRWAAFGLPRFAGRWDDQLNRWQRAGGALVLWSTDDDNANNPDAPYVDAAVWVPPVD